MIAVVRGVFLRKTGRQVVIDVNGLGFEIMVPDSTAGSLPPIGETIQLDTLTVVQEDGIHLYGFATRAEKEFFRLLSSVSKVGAKTAMEVVSAMTVDQFREALISGQMSRLLTASGVGKKLAERIRFELKDKVGALPVSEIVVGVQRTAPMSDKSEDAVRGLMYLGLRDLDARRFVEQAQAQIDENASVQDIIKEALRLSRE